MALNHLVVLDFETGGYSPKANPAMEIALRVLDPITLEEVARWETLIKPYDGLICTQGALDTHGITVSECKNRGMEIKEMVKILIEIFKKFTPKGDKGGGRPILAGHNVGFDINYLRDIFERCGEQLHSYVLSSGDSEIVVYDTLPIFKFFYPEPKVSYKLGEVCKRIGLGDFVAHRAMPDVIACSEVIVHLKTLSSTEGGKAKLKAREEIAATGKDRTVPQSNTKRLKFEF